jgi:hypothetical protein
VARVELAVAAVEDLDARTAGVAVGMVTQTAIGDQNVQLGGAVNSPVNVSYGTPPPAAPGGSRG